MSKEKILKAFALGNLLLFLLLFLEHMSTANRNGALSAALDAKECSREETVLVSMKD
jgi:hypothetical protein